MITLVVPRPLPRILRTTPWKTERQFELSICINKKPGIDPSHIPVYLGLINHPLDHCRGDDPQMVIAVYKTRFQGIRLDVSGWILPPDQPKAGCDLAGWSSASRVTYEEKSTTSHWTHAGCHQPARVADKTS